MHRLLALCGMLCLVLALSLPAMAGGRHSNERTGGISQSQLSAAGAQAMTKEQVLDFIHTRKGRLKGNFNDWNDSLRFFDDGTVKGETSGNMGRSMPGSGSWSVDEDGTLHLSIKWRYSGPQESSGKLFQQDDYVYQMDTSAPDKPWLYRFKR